MEDLFGQIEFRSKSDSIVMKILRSAMDRTHEKLQLMDGPIEFLHERTTFYELAAILVEGGLNIVQEETDILEGSSNKILSDLTEIRQWLQGRIQDMKRLIVEKDRELMERLENETNLRQALELRDKEDTNDCNVTIQDESTISKLKSSVDQQVLNIKQKLEDEKKILKTERRARRSRASSPSLSFDFLDKERSGSLVFTDDDLCFASSNTKSLSDLSRLNQNVLIRGMSSDIEILKETLDLAFGRMQSADVFPLERQWRWVVEKDVESVVLKGFINDVRENFDVQLKKKVDFMKDNWSEFISEIRTLFYDLKSFFPRNEANEKGIGKNALPRVRRTTSESFLDVSILDQDNVEDNASNHVAKMIKNHESIICKQREKSTLSSSRMKKEEKDRSRQERRIQDAIRRLDNFTKRNHKLVDKSGVCSTNRAVERRIPSSKTKTNSISGKEFELFTQKLQEEKDEFYFQTCVMEDINKLLFRSMINDVRTVLRSNIINSHAPGTGAWCPRCRKLLDPSLPSDCFPFEESIESLIKEKIYIVFLREIAETWKLQMDAFAIEKDLHHLVVTEALKEARTEAEALKQFDFQERMPRSRRFNPDSCQEGTPRSCRTGADRDENLIQKVDSLLRCLEVEEDLMLQASSTIKEHSVNNSFVILNCEEMEERNAIEWLITDDESTFCSVSEKLERALQQLYTSKELLADLEESLEESEEFREDADLNNELRFEQEDEHSSQAVQTDEVLMIIVQFRRFLDNVEHELHQKLQSKCLRLEKLKRQVDMLTQPVVWMRKRKLLYKKAFISRCHNLSLAETEVDLLGDQVESLVYLLEKIYVVLNRNATVLSVYFEVYELLKLIKIELNNEWSFKHSH